MAPIMAQVSPAHLIAQEISTVTSAMRKNQRWSSSSSTNLGYMGLGASSSSSSRAFSLAQRQNGGTNSHDGNAGKRQRITSGYKVQGNGKEDLLAGFMALRMELRQVSDIRDLDSLALLAPFLAVVRSPETSGPITACALTTLSTFLSLSLLSPTSPSAALAMQALSSAATHCKFEASDGVSDEIVLLKILEVLRELLTGEMGTTLGDESVCEMMETGLSMCCQMRLSEMLRKSAERTMTAMVSSVFSKLDSLPDEVDERATAAAAASAKASSASPSASTTLPAGAAAGTDTPTEEDALLRVAAPDPQSEEVPSAAIAGADDGAAAQEARNSTDSEEDEDEDETPAPYGLPSLHELLRVLISLLNPHDQQHTDSMRLLALGLLNTAFEVGGKSVGRFAGLRALVGDELCKHLFQLARSENTQLVAFSLRVIATIFDTMPSPVGLQKELLLSFLVDRLTLPAGMGSGPWAMKKEQVEQEFDRLTWDSSAGPVASSSSALKKGESGSSASGAGGGKKEGASIQINTSGMGITQFTYQGSPESRELMLEMLGGIARDRWEPVRLWANYDAKVGGEDVLERLVRFMARGVWPSMNQPVHQSAGLLQDNSQLLCLDALLEFVGHLSSRDDSPPPALPSSAPTADELEASKKKKSLLMQAAAAFNTKPKDGIKFIVEHGLAMTGEDGLSKEESLAKFLKTTPRLNKHLLGDWISRPEQIEVLRAFMKLIHFQGKIICDALRDLLEAFRLPGEAQPIARITETFAELYFATGPPEIKSQDATYVLSYSVILLNTDQHNPQVKKRMDIAAYSRNLRGVNDGSDFSPAFLKSIHDSIRKREIVMPEEQQNQVGFEHGWKELLKRSQDAGPYVDAQTSDYDASLFKMAWRPVVSAISFAFANFHDDLIVQRSITGLNQLATLAAKFDLPEVFDYLILSLASISGLTQPKAGALPEGGSFPTIDVEGQKVTVSPAAVKFGTNVKAQLAAVVLFTIANNNGTSIREGWRYIFEILQTLFMNSLLPAPLAAMEDFLSGESVIPLKPKVAVAPRDDRRSDGGLLSTLSSYLMSPYGAGPETVGHDYSDDDIENALSAMDCIASCRIEELYAQILTMRGASLVAPVQAVVTLAQQATIDRLRPRAASTPMMNAQISPPQPGSTSTTTTALKTSLPYDPSAVLLVEIMSSVISKSEEAISDLWPMAFDFFTKLLSQANSFSILFNERVVAALLRLSTQAVRQDDLRDSVFLALDMLRGLPPAVLVSTAEPMMVGLSRMFSENADRIHSATEWVLIFALFSATSIQEGAAKLSFDLLRRLSRGDVGHGIQADNYAPFLHVLAGYATPTGTLTTKAGDRPSDDPVAQRERQIVDILRDMQAGIPSLIEASPLSPSKAWESYWIPLLAAYAQLCLNPSRDLRQTAVGSLQRTLLAPEILMNSDVDLTIIFERVFFPMLEELLKPQVFRRDPEGMGETRLRASALLCKIFLQYLVQLSERQGMQRMTELWLKILGYQDRFMHSGRRDQMFEAVPESLKNVLLVMNASGFLIPPYASRTKEQVELWDATFERISPFLPNLQNDLFPPPKVQVPFADQARKPTANGTAPPAKPADEDKAAEPARESIEVKSLQ